MYHFPNFQGKKKKKQTYRTHLWTFTKYLQNLDIYRNIY